MLTAHDKNRAPGDFSADHRTTSCSPQPHSPLDNSPKAMSENKEGSSNKEGSDVYISTTAAPQQQFYDPSKESIWTRAGLSLESYKRAPGTTG